MKSSIKDVCKFRVSIIISMYNRKLEIIETIDSLLFPSLLNNGCLDTELILLDDRSPLQVETALLVAKYLPDLTAKFGSVVYSRSPANLGFAKSYNRGISMARGEKLVIANDDLYFPRKSIEHLVQTLGGPEGYSIVGPVTNASTSWSYQYCKQAPRILGYAPQETEKLEAFARWLESAMKDKRVQTDNLCGFCLAADADFLKAIGGFDEKYGYGFYEDTDLIQRIASEYGKEKIGINLGVFVSHGGVNGPSGTALQQPLKMAYALLVNNIKYANSWGYGKLLRRLVYGFTSQLTGKGTISDLFPEQIDV